MECRHFWSNYWRCFVFLGTLVVFSPLIFYVGTSEAKCAYILAVMVTFWLTETFPLPITGLIPIVLAPMLGLVPAAAISKEYFKDRIMQTIGSLLMATSIEYWDLHHRIALLTLNCFGGKPRWVMLGIMLPTWFLSMWISNTCTTSMMLPISGGIVDGLRICKRGSSGVAENENNELPEDDHQQNHIDNPTLLSDRSIELSDIPPIQKFVLKPSLTNEETNHFNGLRKCFAISIAYAANCGGIGTIIGTGPNIILAGLISEEFGGDKLTFVTWMGFAVPVSFICLIFVWVWLQIWFLGIRELFCPVVNERAQRRTKNFIKLECAKLGNTTYAQYTCIGLFLVMVTLWMTRVSGWEKLIPSDKREYISDGTIAMFVSILLFIMPCRNPFKKQISSELTTIDEAPHREQAFMMTWPGMRDNFPWSIILLIGGGYGLAYVFKVSGLTVYMGKQLQFLEAVNPALLVFVVVMTSAFATEFMSNTATVLIILPVLLQLARCIHMHPFMLLVPTTISVSFAFCLPAATPPNAIVIMQGGIKVKEMLSAGIFVNLACILIVTCSIMTYGRVYYGLDTFPPWGGQCVTNSTSTQLSNLTLPLY